MNDFWRNALDCFTHLVQCYPNIPIAVMPSSYHFERTDFPSILANRETPCHLFAREKMSYELLVSMKFPDSVHVHLDDDMALCMSDSDWMRNWKRHRERSVRDYILVVERRDIEHHGSSQSLSTDRKFSLPSPIKGRILDVVRPYRRAYLRSKWRKSQNRTPEKLSEEFREECQRLLEDFDADLAGIPWIEGDVSDPLKYSFDEFCRLISEARAVITTRLHVALFGAMVGVPTLVRCGRYGKIHGVWENSLQGFSNVHLFREGRLLDKESVGSPEGSKEQNG